MVSYDHKSLGLRAQLAGHSWADLHLRDQQAPPVLKLALCPWCMALSPVLPSCATFLAKEAAIQVRACVALQGLLWPSLAVPRHQ